MIKPSDTQAWTEHRPIGSRYGTRDQWEIRRESESPHRIGKTGRDQDALSLAERLRFALQLQQECVVIDPEIRSGVPVIKGTRIPVARIVAELAGGLTIHDIADELEIDDDQLVAFLEMLAIQLDRPFAK